MKEVLTFAALASFFAVKSICPAAELQRNFEKIPKTELKLTSKQFKDAIAKSTTSSKSYNGMNLTNVINAVARTIYAEARSEGKEGMDAVASVIWNRAGGKADNLVKVISKKLQFSCWNKYEGGWTDKTYTPFPSTPRAAAEVQRKPDIWEYCKSLAQQMIDGKFTSTIGKDNLYLNKATAGKKALNSWGLLCTRKIGKHSFGYAKDQDGCLKTLKA